MKMNLPVMLLREASFLPYTTLKLEFGDENNKEIIEEAEFFHDGKLLVAFQKNPLEEIPTIEDIASIGVMAKVKQKIELPDGQMRVTLEGLERVQIYEFLNESDPLETLESVVICGNEKKIDPKIEETLISKLYKEIENFVSIVSYVSDGFLSQIKEVKSLSKLTDITVSSLSYPPAETQKYVEEFDPSKRTEMLLTSLYKAKESYLIESEIEDKVQEEMDQSQKEYLIKEKIKMLKAEVGEGELKEEEIKGLREKLDTKQYPEPILQKLEKEIHRYELIPMASPELNVVRNYIDVLEEIPFSIYTNDNEDLKDVQKVLCQSHYALGMVKRRIIEFLASKKVSDHLKSPILCFVGPPGVGKTSLAHSIALALHRSFVKMSVGGMNDESEIVGHRRTYLGASSGKIISLLMKAGSMNPVFLIDEIDKMTKNEKGDPTSTLLEVLDPVQNKYFVDHYVEEEVDLSKVLFITTANDVSKIPLELKDRLEIIQLEGYMEYEKIDIARAHLLPSICEEYNISDKKIAINEAALTMIIREYTKEAGVRELERKLSEIVRKIVAAMVLEKQCKDTYYISKSEIPLYLEAPIYPTYKETKRKKIGVVNGLAYTSYGGDTLRIEVTYFKGKGDLILTGCLGRTMKESAHLALSYVKAHASYFHIDPSIFVENDIHIHVPSLESNKDGPSAGMAVVTALISSLSKMKIASTIALSGEMTLTGMILPVGKIKEKVVGAYQNQMEKLILPFQNKKEVERLPLKIRNTMEIIYVKEYKECFKILSEEENIGVKKSTLKENKIKYTKVHKRVEEKA